MRATSELDCLCCLLYYSYKHSILDRKLLAWNYLRWVVLHFLCRGRLSWSLSSQPSSSTFASFRDCRRLGIGGVRDLFSHAWQLRREYRFHARVLEHAANRHGRRFVNCATRLLPCENCFARPSWEDEAATGGSLPRGISAICLSVDHLLIVRDSGHLPDPLHFGFTGRDVVRLGHYRERHLSRVPIARLIRSELEDVKMRRAGHASSRTASCVPSVATEGARDAGISASTSDRPMPNFVLILIESWG